VQEARRLLQEAYLSQESQSLWTGAPVLLQFGRRLGRVSEAVPHHELLKDIDYSSQFETVDQFSSEIEIISIKSFLNAVAKKKGHTFFIKGHPGSGKTALLQRLCAFWARGFCLRRYTLVLWLDLKAHPNPPSRVSLRTLLSYCLPQGSYLDSIQQWLDVHGAENVLMMIDHCEGRACDQWKLSQVLASRWLKKASFVLTDASTRITELSHTQFDLIGLSQDQVVTQVLYHYRDHASRAEEFLMYISESRKIRALCSSPPYLAAVLFVFDNINTSDPPNSWTQLFTSFTLSLASVSDLSTLAYLISEEYAATNTSSSFDCHPSYANFRNTVIPPYHTMVTPADNACFSLPLLQHYLCARHIHSLPRNQHAANLNQKTLSFYEKQFYLGLCNSSEREDVVHQHEEMRMSAACISEIPVEELQDLMSSRLTSTDQLLSTSDIHCIFQAVYHSRLACSLQFVGCCFRLEMMEKWLKVISPLPVGGTVQELE